MKAQTIQIDRIFSSDGEIFPFSPNDTIYGLSITGSVTLNSDTSLVRVILTDDSGNKWMVYEAYPMIVSEPEFEIEEECDESCYLNEFVPFSMQVQIINAYIHIDSLTYSSEGYGDMESMQYQSKRNKDLEKIQLINQYISAKGWDWIADENEIVGQYYSSKARLFGYINYNVRGFEYYKSGEFRYVSNRSFIQNSGTIRNEFDWKAKHDANVDGTPYYSSDGYGWITDLRNQHSCGSCWVFSSVASVEAVANLYFNQHCDYDLSEQDVLCCSPGTGDCDGGYTYNSLNYLKNSGTFNEQNYIYFDGYYPSCCGQDLGNPDYILKCDSKTEVSVSLESIDLIKTSLINSGPLVTWILSETLRLNHAMSLIGYYTDYATNEIRFIFKDSYENIRIIPLSWEDIESLYTANYPITFPLGATPERIIWDKDNDGYYNWGIGDIPQGWEHPCGLNYQVENMEDWNDNQNRFGPHDDNFIGQPVIPEIKILIFKQTQSGYEYVEINHGDLVYIDQNDLNIFNQLSCKIENPGNAQLNLVQESLSGNGKITIEYENPGAIYAVDEVPPMHICMSDEQFFKIKIFDTEVEGAVATIQVWINEDEIDDFAFTLIYNSCETLTGFDAIQGVQEWPEPYRSQLKDLHVMDNGQLTISGTVILSPEVDIIVEPGGKLIIYGGMIEFADTAVSTSQVHGIYTTPTGGIINCKDAVFKDNYMGVCLYPYVSPLGNPNFCCFKRTQFKITDDYYNLDNLVRTAPKCGIQLKSVIGLFIEGCNFINESSAEQLSRGTGLIDLDVGCFVTGACELDNQIPCEKSIPSGFEGLDYGIRALNIWSSRTISVDSVDFTDNYRGIYLGLVNDASINKNHFYLNADDDYFEQDDILIGIYLERCNRYQVEENQIFGADPDNFELIGMHILNSGTDHTEIYNNSFNNVDYGIIAAGENRREDTGVGLCIKCNDFSGCINDISVTPSKDENENPIITENTGIALWQGEEGDGNDLAAGNTFSENAEYNYINDEGCQHIDYTHHNENSTGEKVKPLPTAGEINVNPDEDAFYSKEESCPSHLAGGGITLSQEKILLYSETELISAYKDSLIAMIDGGNTVGLNYEVQSSIPEEALEIRQDLLDESPFLSDTVMISAIEKEDVLPGAMVRDVLIANPHAPKSIEVMNALNQRQDTIPGYMMEEILVGMTVYGEKELLEQELGHHIANRDMAWRNLNLNFKGDTSNAGPYSDSLIVLYQNENRPEAKYDLCFMYLSREDSSSLTNTLSDIPIEFDLSTNDLYIHSQYLDLFGILWDVKPDSTGLDSLQIQSLYNLSTPIHSVPANYAFNLLISEDLIGYNEPVYSVELLKSVTAPAQSPKVNESPERLIVFPNPAGNYFIVQYDLSGFTENGVLAISDMNGKELIQYGLPDMKNQVVMSAGEYPTGTYLISMLRGNKLMASCKISIIR